MNCRSFLSYLSSIEKIGEPEGVVELLIAGALRQALVTDALFELLALTEDEDFAVACANDVDCFMKWVESKLEECMHEVGSK